ncbi:hypothetical protein M758_UG339000 [Ceratodon purpureus]|nr:hypothetical protein M758_UG339000 [Ceratodon purpureus]
MKITDDELSYEREESCTIYLTIFFKASTKFQNALLNKQKYKCDHVINSMRKSLLNTNYDLKDSTTKLIQGWHTHVEQTHNKSRVQEDKTNIYKTLCVPTSMQLSCDILGNHASNGTKRNIGDVDE